MTSQKAGSRTEARRRSLRNVFTNWGAFIIIALVNFMLSPFIVGSLGNDAYGVWVLLGSLVGYLGLLDLGVRGAVTKYIATHHAAERHDQASRVASAALSIFGATGLVAIVASVLFARFGLGVFDIPESVASVAGLVLMIGGVTIATSIVSGVFGGVIVGRQRFDLLNGMSVVVDLGRALLVYLSLLAGGGLIELALVQLGASMALALASVVVTKKIYPELHIRVWGFGREHVRSIMSFGIFASMLHVAGSIINYTDSLVIGTILPVKFITFFAIAASLVEYARNFAGGISRTITPMAGALEGQDEAARVGDILILGGRYSTLVVLPIAVTFIFRGHTFIGLWMGPEYAKPAGDVLVLLAIGLWAIVGLQVGTATMMGVNKHGGMVPAFAVEAFCNICLSVWLIHSYGILGVAVGTLVPRLVMCLLFGPWYARKMLGVAISRYWSQVLLRPTFSIVFFAFGSWFVETYWPVDGLLFFFVQVAITMPLALLGAWIFFLDREERATYSAALRQRLAVARG